MRTLCTRVSRALEISMLDLLFLATLMIGFVSCLAYVTACERL